MKHEQTVGILPAHGTTDNERCGIDIEHRDNGETWLIVYAGGRKDDLGAPFTIDAAARLTPNQRAAVIAALRGDAPTGPTDAAAHATAALSIIDDIAEWHLGANVLLVTARRHILALDAARVAAEQRAERLRRLAIAARDIVADGVSPKQQQRYLYALAQCAGHHDLDIPEAQP